MIADPFDQSTYRAEEFENYDHQEFFDEGQADYAQDFGPNVQDSDPISQNPLSLENLEKYNLYKMSIHEKRARLAELYSVFGMNTVGGQKLYELFGESYRKQAKFFVPQKRSGSDGSTRQKRKPEVPKARFFKKQIQIAQSKNSKNSQPKFHYNKKHSKTTENHRIHEPTSASRNAQKSEQGHESQMPNGHKFKVIQQGGRKNGFFSEVSGSHEQSLNQGIPPNQPDQSEYEFITSSRLIPVDSRRSEFEARPNIRSANQFQNKTPEKQIKQLRSKSSYHPNAAQSLNSQPKYTNHFSDYKSNIKKRIFENALMTKSKKEREAYFQRSPT